MEKINFERINELRKSVVNVNKDACTFNQAVKSLQGLEKKHDKVCAALNITSFGFKSICEVWHADLHVTTTDNKSVMGLYMWETAKVTTTNEKGEPKEVNAYERVVNKKGVVSYKAIKLRVLQQPKAWSHDVILEGLCQSAELAAAKEEARLAQEYFDGLVDTDEVYIKKTIKGADGSVNISYERAY